MAAEEFDFTPVEGMTEESLLKKYQDMEHDTLSEDMTVLLGILRNQGIEIHFPSDDPRFEAILSMVISDVIRIERISMIERIESFIQGIAESATPEQMQEIATESGLQTISEGLSDVLTLGSLSMDDALDYSNLIRLLHIRDCDACRSGAFSVLGDPHSSLFAQKRPSE